MRKGFTLIELIVVIAIIAVLAAVVAPNAFKAIEKGKRSAGIADYKSIKTAAMAYYADTGQWPIDGAGDCGFVTIPDGSVAGCAAIAGLMGWDGPYIEKWPPKTPWGGSYVFSNADWDTDGDTDKYISLEDGAGNPVINADSADKIDQQIDGASAPGTGYIVDDTGGADFTNDFSMIISDM